MIILTIFCCLFIVYEFMKLVFIRSYWEKSQITKTGLLPKTIKIIEIIYAIFLIFILFYPPNVWYFSIGIIGITFITASKLSEFAQNKDQLNIQIKRYLITDNIMTVLLLAKILLTII